MILRQLARDLLGAEVGEAALAAGDLGVKLLQALHGGGYGVILDPFDVPGQPRPVGVEVAVVGEHEHVKLGTADPGRTRA